MLESWKIWHLHVIVHVLAAFHQLQTVSFGVQRLPCHNHLHLLCLQVVTETAISTIALPVSWNLKMA